MDLLESVGPPSVFRYNMVCRIRTEPLSPRGNTICVSTADGGRSRSTHIRPGVSDYGLFCFPVGENPIIYCTTELNHGGGERSSLGLWSRPVTFQTSPETIGVSFV